MQNYNSKKLEITQVSNTTEVSDCLNKLQCISVVENCITIKSETIMYNNMEKYPLCVCACVRVHACECSYGRYTNYKTISHKHISANKKLQLCYVYLYRKKTQEKTPYGKVGLFEGEKFSF